MGFGRPRQQNPAVRPLFISILLLMLATIVVGATPVDLKLAATPTEVAAGGGLGRTLVEWESETDDARLCVLNPDGTVSGLGAGRSGKFDFLGVIAGRESIFRLQEKDCSGGVLASVSVTGTYTVEPLPDLSLAYRVLFKAHVIPTIAVIIALLSVLLAWRRPKYKKLAKTLVSVAAVIVIAWSFVFIAKSRPYPEQPAPDALETIDAANNLAHGMGYVTTIYGKPQPPRYPPGFSALIAPFALFGEYPANVMLGVKIYALIAMGLMIWAAWRQGKQTAAMFAGFFIVISPFLGYYIKVAMTEPLTSGLIVLISVLLIRPTTRGAALAGMICGVLLLIRMQLIVVIPPLLIALPSKRMRVTAAATVIPFGLIHGVYNWLTFGSPLRSGYSYWLPDLKPFAMEFALRYLPQGDGPLIFNDVLNGYFARWFCPCDGGGPLAAMPNLILYPVVILGFFWLFAPPFVTGYGLWRVWQTRASAASRFTLWLIVFTVPLFTFYFYQAPRFMAAICTLLLIAAAVGLAERVGRVTDPVPG